jgi:type IV pilus assembly protein PilV
MNSRARGFSLVEVMVALIVMSIGLLGIAKMQAAALSNTAIASTRSLAAIEASSLASSMHANRGYWSSPSVATTITLRGETVTPNVAPAGGCTGASCCVAVSCTPAELAAHDLQDWTKAALQVLPPDYQAQITCTPAPPGTPPNCTIQIQWAEKSVAVNKDGRPQSGADSLALNVPKYELYVEP